MQRSRVKKRKACLEASGPEGGVGGEVDVSKRQVSTHGPSPSLQDAKLELLHFLQFFFFLNFVLE